MFKHTPRLKIKGFWGQPEHPSFTTNVMADSEWKSAISRNEAIRLRRYDLDANLNENEEDQHRAISLDYTLDGKDNRLADYTQIVSKEERELRTAALEIYKKEKADLEKKKENSTDGKLSDDDAERLVDVTNLIKQLEEKGPGYLEVSPDAFGDGRQSIYQSLSVPNVPSHLISNFKIEKDRPFCLWLYRFKAHEEQEDPSFNIIWGHWRLELKQDNNAVLYRYVDKTNRKQIDLVEKEIKDILDLGRLTLTDKRFIETQKDAIEAVKAKAKEDGRSSDEYTDEEKLAIKNYELAIDARRESKKGLSADQEDTIKELKAQIYADTQNVNLHEASQSLYNVPLRLVFLPQRRGYLTIQLLDATQPFVYEDKVITKTRQTGTMWEKTPFEIRTNGGAYILKYGNPLFAKKGTLKLNPCIPGWDVATEDREVRGQTEKPAGTDIEFEFIKVDNGMVSPYKAPSFQLSMLLTSDGNYAPYLYSANLFAPAGDRDGSLEVEWDSIDHLDSMDCPAIEEVTPQFESDRRRVVYEVTLLDRYGALSQHVSNPLPIKLHDRLADLSIENSYDGEVTVLTNGIIKQAIYEEVQDPDRTAHPYTRIRLIIADMFAALDDDVMEDAPVGDNRPLGEYIRTVLKGRGITDDELDGVPVEAGRLLPAATIGEKPAVQPSKGVRRGDFLRNLLDTFAYDEYLWVSENGIFQFGAFDPTIKAAFTTDASNNTRFRTRSTVTIPEDFCDYYNVFVVEGAADPLTKKRVSRKWTLWDSILNPNHASYIGRTVQYPTLTNDTLRTEDDIIWALRSLVYRYAKPGRYMQFTAHYQPTLWPGDHVTIDEVECEIVRIATASIAEDTMELIVRRLEG